LIVPLQLLRPESENATRVAGPSEVAARATLSVQAGRTLSDAEWERMRARLTQFLAIFRDWRRHAVRTNQSTAGNAATILETTATSESVLDRAA
jgi:hypothetical protein